MSEHDPSLASRLPRIDAGRARVQTAMIGAFNRRLLDGLHTHARLAPERDRRAAAGWLRFRTRGGTVSIAPLLVDGALARVAGAPGQPDAVAVAALLGPIEPLIVAIEAALGDELHPDGLDAAIGGDPVLIRLDAGPAGGPPSTRLLIALPPDIAVDPVEPATLDPSALRAVRLRWSARLAGPAVPQRRMAALAVGDLIVLGINPLQATLSILGHGDRWAGRVELNRGIVIVDDQPIVGAGATDPELDAPAPSVDLEQLRIPTIIEIAGGSVAAGELATLAPGSVLPLPANSGTLAVTLHAGDALVAHGELVAVGEGFGLLVTALPARG